MIYAITDVGPWIDLDEIVAIEQAPIVGELSEQITVYLGNGSTVVCYPEQGCAATLAGAWIEHRMQQDEPGRQPRKRTL